jgi:hypothetical protein
MPGEDRFERVDQSPDVTFGATLRAGPRKVVRETIGQDNERFSARIPRFGRHNLLLWTNPNTREFAAFLAGL